MLNEEVPVVAESYWKFDSYNFAAAQRNIFFSLFLLYSAFSICLA